jgi:UDP-N-acetylmuramate dehydrogenase
MTKQYDFLYRDLVNQFPDFEIHQNHSLAPYTTLRIGGPADIFIHTKNTFQFKSILKYLYKLNQINNFSDRSERGPALAGEPEGSEDRKNSLIGQIPITILGNGSNVLISDSGLRGIVIKNSAQKIQILGDETQLKSHFQRSYTQRHEDEPEKYLDFAKIDYDESDSPVVKVKVAAGTPLPYAINYLLDQGITGLQWFAYIPGTVGGATWYNIHGGAYHFSDYIHSIRCFNLQTGKIEKYRKNELNWKYEKSYFQQNPHLVILETTLKLFLGDAPRAKATRDAWIAQKVKVQPMNSPGSAFANPSLEDCIRVWGEQKSTGFIIDHELNLKGTQIGGAQISLQHANFFINTGSATAKDYLALINLVKSQTKEKFGLDLEPEVKFLGDFS